MDMMHRNGSVHGTVKIFHLGVKVFDDSVL